jgi:imidazolonepropionase-like amidohydrolase
MGLNRAQAMLRAGFTTVRDVGNAANYADTDLRLAIEAGLFEGPKIFNSGKIIAPLGGQSDRVSPDVGNCWSYEYIDADGPDAIRKAIRQNIFYGARVIKVVNDSRGGTHGIYSDEELRVAVDEAHRAGLTIAVHAKEDKTAIPAIVAGADSIEHGYHLTIDAFRLMAKHKTYFVPTDMPPRYLDGNANDIEGNVDAKVKRLAMAYKLGVPLVFGTDTTFDRKDDDRGEMAPHYLEIWSRAKIPNMVVLQALTSNAAALLRIEKEAGRISDGFVADIIAVPSDPVLDVSAIGKVHFVMKDGAIIRE